MSEEDYSGWSGLAKQLVQVIDVRSLRGRRYKWGYLLVLIAAALLAGEKTLVSMHDWLYRNEKELVHLLQPQRRCGAQLVNVEQSVAACQRRRPGGGVQPLSA